MTERPYDKYCKYKEQRKDLSYTKSFYKQRSECVRVAGKMSYYFRKNIL